MRRVSPTIHTEGGWAWDLVDLILVNGEKLAFWITRYNSQMRRLLRQRFRVDFYRNWFSFFVWLPVFI